MPATDRKLTAKGQRQAEAILDAAITCLGRDGYSSTSLQSVAAEAGTQKRMVVYYFGSKSGLLAAVVERIGEDFFNALEEMVVGLTDPEEVLDTLLEAMTDRLLENRAMQVAYYGLVAESVTDPGIRENLTGLRQRAIDLADRVLDDLEAAGHELTMDRKLLMLVTSAGVQGLGLEVLERGHTRELDLVIALTRAALPHYLFE